jgi:hypothetical protein
MATRDLNTWLPKLIGPATPGNPGDILRLDENGNPAYEQGFEIPDSISTGGILYWDGTTLAVLPIGAEGTTLTVVDGLPSWDAPAPPFDPATFSLTGWWRGSYSASPWTGTASAGASGSRNLSEATNPPAAGAAVNGFTPADFDGTNDLLASAATVANFFGASSTGWSGWVLVNADTLAADNSYNAEPLLLGDNGGNLAVTLATSGARLTSWTSAPAVITTPYAAFGSTGTYRLVQFRWTGAQIQIRVNDGAWQSAACASFWAAIEGNTFRVGGRPGSAFLDGKILDCGLDDSSMSDADFDNIRSYVNARYGVTV